MHFPVWLARCSRLGTRDAAGDLLAGGEYSVPGGVGTAAAGLRRILRLASTARAQRKRLWHYWSNLYSERRPPRLPLISLRLFWQITRGVIFRFDCGTAPLGELKSRRSSRWFSSTRERCVRCSSRPANSPWEKPIFTMTSTSRATSKPPSTWPTIYLVKSAAQGRVLILGSDCGSCQRVI